MPYQYWAQSLIEAHADGPAVTSITEVTILPSPAVYTMPANFLREGSKLRLTFGGRYTSPASSTLRIILRYGAVGSGVIWFDTTALTLLANQTNATFRVKADLTVRSIGAGTGATLIAVGEQYGLLSASGITLIPATAPAVSAGFDSTLATAINLGAIWSTATGTSLTLHEYCLESLN